jgi:hypothetical protein
MHHLRFDSEAAKRQVAAQPALRVEGIIRHPPLEQPLEYYVIIAVRNDRGEEVTRQVVNVGALQAAEKRTFTLSVEVLPPSAPVPTKSGASASQTSSTGSYKSSVSQPTVTTRPGNPPAQQAPVADPAGAAKSPANASDASGSPNPAPMSNAPAKPGSTAGAAQAAKQLARQSPPGASTKPPVPSATPPSSAAKPPASPATPTSAADQSGQGKPASGYVLKPPTPGGPKRH